MNVVRTCEERWTRAARRRLMQSRCSELRSPRARSSECTGGRGVQNLLRIDTTCVPCRYSRACTVRWALSEISLEIPMAQDRETCGSPGGAHFTSGAADSRADSSALSSTLTTHSHGVPFHHLTVPARTRAAAVTLFCTQIRARRLADVYTCSLCAL